VLKLSETSEVLDVTEPNIIEILKERWKGRDDEEEDVSNCWMTLRKREDTGN
jgi:hypothetical protein